MYRVRTRLLDDESLTQPELSSHIERWVDTPSTGGTAIDAEGNIYLSDVNKPRILKISPERKITSLIQDPRLVWPDALWIDGKGFLWIPIAQNNRAAPFQGGRSRVQLPGTIYKMRLGARPAPNDHHNGAEGSTPSPPS
jgi:sugar lactone lactonase YvrE